MPELSAHRVRTYCHHNRSGLEVVYIDGRGCDFTRGDWQNLQVPKESPYSDGNQLITIERKRREYGTMPEPLPKFDAPPVVETVIGVQFSRLPKFSTPYAGWFWRDLGDAWNEAIEAPRIEDQFETFEGPELWMQSFPMVRFQGLGSRVQIIRRDRERMIQLQDTRFLLNWQKQATHYPSFDVLFQEFTSLFPSFERFAQKESLGDVELNQWEVTYVNHIPRGELWDSVSDWHQVLPQFYPPDLQIPTRMESRSGDWRFVLADSSARLYISVRHAKTMEAKEVLSVTLTARGPLHGREAIAAGLDIGHSAIVRSFTAITSKEAHKLWKRRV